MSTIGSASPARAGLRATAWAAGACVLWSQCLPVWALSLGPIRVQSGLGEPFKAVVTVSSLSADEAATLKVEQASASLYTQAGFTRSASLELAEVSLTRRPDGGMDAQIRGRRPVSEPYLDFVLVARSSSGELRRDYTLLIDPPRQGPASQAGTPAAASATPSPARQASQQAPRQATASPEPAAWPRPAGGAIVVQPDETAFSLANRYRPEGATIAQMQWAMLKRNPSAFRNGRIEHILSGATIRLPSREQVMATSPAEALAALNPASARQPGARPAATAASGHEAVAASAASASASPSPTASSAAATTATTQPHGAAPAAPLPAPSTAAAPAPAVPVPPSQTAAPTTAQAENGHDKPATEPAPASSDAATEPAGANAAETDAAAEAEATLPEPESIEIPEAAPPAPPPAPAVAPAHPEPTTLWERLSSNLLGWLAATIGIAGLINAWLYFRRRNVIPTRLPSPPGLEGGRRPTPAFVDEPIEMPATVTEAPPAQAAAENAGADTGSLAAEPSSAEPAHATTAAVAAASAAGAAATASGLAAATTHPPAIDAISEAEVYLAYGRIDDAQFVLKEALEHEPGDAAVRRKLEEIESLLADQAQKAIETAQQALQQTSAAPAFAPPTLPAGVAGAGAGTATPSAGLPPLPSLDASSPLAAPAQPPVPPVGSRSHVPPQSFDDASLDWEDASVPTLPTLTAGDDLPAALDPNDSPQERALAESVEHDGAADLEFDMDALSFDLSETASQTPDEAMETDPHDHANLLALAQEFLRVGDYGNARDMAQQVLRDSRGELQESARELLDQIGDKIGDQA